MRPVPPVADDIDRLRPREMVWVEPDSGEAWRGRFYRVENDSIYLLVGRSKRAAGLDRIESLSVRRRSPERVRAITYAALGGAAVVGVLFATGIVTVEAVDEKGRVP